MKEPTLRGAVEKPIGVVTATSQPTEFQFIVNSGVTRPVLQDFVVVEHPNAPRVPVLAKVVRLSRNVPTAHAGKGAPAPEPKAKRDTVAAFCNVIGALDRSGRFRGTGFPVEPGATVYRPSANFLNQVLGGDDPGELHLGHLRNRPDVPVAVKANELLNKHVAVLAMTGAGKTYATSVLLEELMRRGYPLLIIDPHGDYIGLGEGRHTNFKISNGRRGKYNLKVFEGALALSAYGWSEFVEFVDNLSEEHGTPAQREILRQAYERTVKTEHESTAAFLDAMTRNMKKVPGVPATTLAAVQRRLAFMREQLGGVEADLTLDKIREALGPGRGAVLSLAQLPAPLQRNMVAHIVQRLFDQRKLFVTGSSRQQVPPTMIVVEEAHNFAPSAAADEHAASRSPLRRIATEGRKFGVSLCVISQRPSALDATVLSQCNSQIILRVVNPNDQQRIAQSVDSLAREDIFSLPDLSQGEAMVSGTMVRVPTVLKIRKRFSPEGIPTKNRLRELGEVRYKRERAPKPKRRKRAARKTRTRRRARRRKR